MNKGWLLEQFRSIINYLLYHWYYFYLAFVFRIVNITGKRSLYTIFILFFVKEATNFFFA